MTSWRACHSNVFAKRLESPRHRTHACCLLMFLLLLHLWLCPGHTVSVRTAYPLRTHCYKCQHYGHSHLACKSKQAVVAILSLTITALTLALANLSASIARAPMLPPLPVAANIPIAEKRILVIHHRDRISLADACRAAISQMAKSSHTRLAPPSVAPVTSTAIAEDLRPHPSPFPIVSRPSPAQPTEVRSAELSMPSSTVEGTSGIPQMGFSLPPSAQN